MPAGHMAEQIGYGRRAGQECGIGGDLLNRVALPSPARSEFDEVVVPFAERDEAREEEKLESILHVRGLVAHAADDEVQPLLCRELSPECPVFGEIEGRNLDGRELLDPERILPAGLFVILEAHLDLGPDPAGEEPVVLSDVSVRNPNLAVPEVHCLGPVQAIDQLHLDLVDEGVAPVLLDLALCLVRLIRTDVVVREGVIDDLQAHLDGRLVRRGAVLPEQVLKDKGGLCSHQPSPYGPDPCERPCRQRRGSPSHPGLSGEAVG